MTPGVELALGSMVLLGLADLVYKRGAAAGVQVHHFLLVQAWCFAPGVLVYGLSTGTLAPAPAMLWGAAAGLFSFVALDHFARALKDGSVSLIAPIFRLSFTVTVALAILLLGEPLTAWKLAGLAAALFAVWLLLGSDAGAAPASATAASSLVRALIAMAAMGVANFLYKVGAATGVSPATFLAGQAAVFIFLAMGFAWGVERALKPPPAAWAAGGMAALVFLVALVLMFEGLARGEASALVPITQMGFVVTAAVGVIFLGEAFTLRKVAGLVLALAALAFLGWG